MGKARNFHDDSDAVLDADDLGDTPVLEGPGLEAGNSDRTVGGLLII
jgi:hypothetical protein